MNVPVVFQYISCACLCSSWPNSSGSVGKCLPSAPTLSMIRTFCELMRRTQAVCDVMFVPFRRCTSTPIDAAMALSCLLAHHAFTLSLSSRLAGVAIARTCCASLEMVVMSEFLRTACLMCFSTF